MNCPKTLQRAKKHLKIFYSFAINHYAMDYKELSKQEYTARINRVMDYIGQNIDKSIDLSVMADIASFSPYHFHRIFACIVGETPNNFLSRIKLEKAAQLLQDNEKMVITDIAFQCGFNNVSSFSRSFKAYFGVNAKEFRTQRISILDYTAVIFNARHGIDHFFRLCEEMRITVPEIMKYFCVS